VPGFWCSAQHSGNILAFFKPVVGDFYEHFSNQGFFDSLVGRLARSEHLSYKVKGDDSMNEQLQRQLTVASGVVFFALPIFQLIVDFSSTLGQGLLNVFLLPWLLAACNFALARLAWRYRPRTVLVAEAFALLGILGTASIRTYEYIAHALREATSQLGDLTQLQAFLEEATVPLFPPGLLTPLVLLVLTAILWKAEKTHRWMWTVVFLGFLLLPLGRLEDIPLLMLTGDFLLLAGLGYAGWQLISGRYQPISTSQV
jgi:hypothetical protein